MTNSEPGLPVLVAVDEGVGPNPAVEFAFTEAGKRGVGVQVMYAPTRFSDEPGPDLRAGLADALERWSEKYPAVPARLSLRSGLDAGIALTVASRSAQLLVISGSEAWSSLARTLLRRAACPVAVVEQA